MWYVAQGVALLAGCSMVPILNLSLGFCICEVSHECPMLLWVSFGFSDSLLPSGNMPVGGLTTLNCQIGMKGMGSV